MPTTLERIKEEVLAREKPRPEDYEQAERVFELLKQRCIQAMRELGVEGDVMLVGSIAKDTWLRTDRDMDIFIRFPPKLGEEGIRTIGLEVVRRAAGGKGQECYAEHPYVRLEVEGFTVDLVPCFKVLSPTEILSAVDRTPFHTEYVKSKLTAEQRDEVRLLKRFLKGIGVYGAEIKVGGFSGYLTELLIIAYGDFERALREIAKWRPWRTVIDIEGHYDDPRRALRRFKTPLVVIDPVDPSRNAAAAVTLKRMCELIAAARAFLRRPSLAFFYPPPAKPLTHEELREALAERGTHLLAVEFALESPLPPDILWGEIRRSLDGIRTLLRTYDFRVLDADAWSDDEKRCILVFELEQAELPIVEKHLGPPVHQEEHELRFLTKYESTEQAVAGPWIEGDRWVVLRKRKYTDARSLVRERLKEARLGEHLKELAREGAFGVYVDSELGGLLADESFARFLRRFLLKRPSWLEVGEDGEERTPH